jgi:hypothetical protein
MGLSWDGNGIKDSRAWAGGRRGGKNVRSDADNENGLAGLDFVPIGKEHGFADSCAVQVCAVGAFLIDESAAVQAILDSKVHARHKIVVRHGKLRALRGPTDDNGLAARERNRFPSERPRFNL